MPLDPSFWEEPSGPKPRRKSKPADLSSIDPFFQDPQNGPRPTPNPRQPPKPRPGFLKMASDEVWRLSPYLPPHSQGTIKAGELIFYSEQKMTAGRSYTRGHILVAAWDVNGPFGPGEATVGWFPVGKALFGRMREQAKKFPLANNDMVVRRAGDGPRTRYHLSPIMAKVLPGKLDMIWAPISKRLRACLKGVGLI